MRIGGRLRALGLGLALSLATACSSPEQQLAERLAEAREALASGREEDALRSFRAALRLDPLNGELNLEIARLAERTGDAEDAAFFYREAYRLDERLTEALLGEARTSAAVDPESAREALEQLLEHEPSHLEARLLAVELSLGAQDTNAAERHAEAASAAHPEHAEALQARARVRARQVVEQLLEQGVVDPGRYEAAREAYEAALRRQEPGTGGQTLLELAAFVARVQPEDAEAAFARARDGAETHGELAIAAQASREVVRFARASGDRGAIRRALERHVEIAPRDLSAWEALARAVELDAEGGGGAVYARLLAARPDDARAYELVATSRLERRDVAGARRLLEEAAARGLEPPRMLGRLSVILAETGDEAAATEVVGRLQSEYPDATETRIAEARLDLRAGRPERALERLAPLGEEHADRDLWLAIGNAHLDLGAHDEALAAAERALELSPEFWAPGQRLLAAVRHDRGDWAGTLQALGRLLEEGTALTPAERMMRGQALYGVGQPAEGRRVVERLARGPEPFPPAVVTLARTSRPEVAARLLEEALGQDPDDGLLRTEQVLVALRAGRGEQALRLAGALGDEVRPDERELLRAHALVALDRWEQAEAAALRAFDTRPDNARAGGLLAEIYQRRGSELEAIALWEARDAEDPLGAQARMLLATLHQRTGDLDTAIRELERVVDETGLPGAKNDLAYLLARSGRDLDRALELAQDARRRIGREPAVADTLGYVYLRKGMLGPAVGQFEDAIALARRQRALRSVYLFHLGIALRRSGRLADAVSTLEQALALEEAFEDRALAEAELEQARADLSSR